MAQETLIVATLDHGRVREERHNFDPAGNCSRADVTRLIVNRRLQSTLRLDDSSPDTSLGDQSLSWTAVLEPGPPRLAASRQGCHKRQSDVRTSGGASRS